MLNQRIRIPFWSLYIVFYIWIGLSLIEDWDGSIYTYFGIIGRLMVVVGMIGYMLKLIIAYKIIWKILFLTLLLLFSFVVITSLISHQYSMLFRLIFLLPALYALYSYVYRSNHIWRNRNKENKPA